MDVPAEEAPTERVVEKLRVQRRGVLEGLEPRRVPRQCVLQAVQPLVEAAQARTQNLWKPGDPVEVVRVVDVWRMSSNRDPALEATAAGGWVRGRHGMLSAAP